MKDKFYPHAILVHPSVSDEAVWDLIRRTSSKDGGPVILLIEPACEPRKGSHSSHAPWPVFERPDKPTGRGSRKPKARK